MACNLAYHKTSNNGLSEKRTTSLQQTDHLPPIDFTIKMIHFEPPRSRTPLYKGQMAHLLMCPLFGGFTITDVEEFPL